MDAPQSMQVRPADPPLMRMSRALGAMNASTKLAIVCVLCGWFLMNTFIVTLGSLQHGVRFFDLSAVIADPTRLFFDTDTPLHRWGFALVCLVCLLAPLAPHLNGGRVAWLGYLAPLALIVACGALLYWRTSGELFNPPEDPRTLGGGLVRFANDLVHRGADMVSRHVSIGAGSYLALLGAAVLAAQGVRRYRGAHEPG